MSMVMTRAALAAALALSWPAALNAGPLTDLNGASLYVFDGDVGLSSSCYGACATQWSPYVARMGAAMAENWTMVARKDGTMQWSYMGRPVYLGSAAMDRADGVGLPPGWQILMSNTLHEPTSAQ